MRRVLEGAQKWGVCAGLLLARAPRPHGDGDEDEDGGGEVQHVNPWTRCPLVGV